MLGLEAAGVVSGLACVWLAVRQNVWTFPVGLVNNLLPGDVLGGRHPRQRLAPARLRGPGGAGLEVVAAWGPRRRPAAPAPGPRPVPGLRGVDARSRPRAVPGGRGRHHPGAVRPARRGPRPGDHLVGARPDRHDRRLHPGRRGRHGRPRRGRRPLAGSRCRRRRGAGRRGARHRPVAGLLRRRPGRGPDPLR
ncbi:nicotinamide mononucleotide transporter [Actinomyces sp.]|uniref:nicotinamide mononucleotide transporter n=1 Tax=Actinomyces sp. TaxID=29317 RepID=UPI0034C61B76